MRSRQRLQSAWTQLTGTGAAASIGLALLVGVCVFICVAAPRASLHNRTDALQRLFATMPATERSIDATVGYDDFDAAANGKIQAENIAAARAELSANLARNRLPLAPAATDWAGLTTALAAAPDAAASAHEGPQSPQVEIVYRDALRRYSRLIAGRFPNTDTVSNGSRTFQAAVTEATAARFSLHVGSRLPLADGVTLAVTGLVQPRSPAAAFWTIDPTVARPLTIHGGVQSLPFWSGAAFVGPGEVNDLQGTGLDTSDISLQWDFPLRLDGVTADQIASLQHEVTAAISDAGTLVASTNGNPTNVTIATGLATDLNTFVGADGAIGTLLSLLFVSLTLIGAVVVLLGARLLTEHRDGEFALMRARGAALRQLAGLALRAGAVVVLPAAVIAAAIALAVTPGTGDPLAWWLAGLTAVVALAGPPVIAVRRHAAAGRRAGPGEPDPAPGRRARARRLVAEAALICTAAGGLVLLRLQGLPAAGRDDLYLSAAPALVAIPAAVLVVRCYPVVLRALLRLAAARRGVTGYVGLASSARTSLTAVLPAFALVLALAVIAFGAMVRDAVLRGEVAASWQETGADAVVGAAGSGISLPPAAQRAIAAVPGVRRTAAILETQGTIGPAGLNTPVNIAVLDPVQYAAVLADTPVPPFPAAALARPHGGPQAGLVPVLASPAVAILLDSAPIATVGLHTVRVRLAGIMSSTPAMPLPGPFLIFPQWAEGPDQPPPNVMFLDGPALDAKALRAVAQRTAPDVTVTLRSDVLTGLRNSPLPHAGYVAFAEGAVAAAGFTVLILLLTLVLGARSRELTLARLATMGLSPGQASRLVAVETLPAVLAAAVGGIACAGALAPLIGPELNLSAFTGYGLSVPVQADLGALALAAGGLVILTLATLAVQAVAARRRGIGRALRVGE
jgi:putative ABC transport system permease protein